MLEIIIIVVLEIYILKNLLTNKLKNNECVNKFIDNMLNSGLLKYDNIVKKEENSRDECFISEYNRKMKNLFSKNKNSDEMKNNIANIIRDNYEVILNKMKNN
ncbi:hypothetical protein AB6H17_14005 [Proteus vulgaris]|uniref:hypothetical protein n=1 Tax=Proteus vulgaris TaxID=585 RepID=UPI0034DD0327